jgi:hypothetical protein
MPWSLPVSAQALSAGLEADKQHVKGLAGSMVFEMPVRGLLLLALLLTVPLTVPLTVHS